MKAHEPTVHPGKLIAIELGELNLSASAFAHLIQVPKSRITQILNGTRSITPDTALRLSHFLGTTAMYWMNLQARYDLVQAHRALKHELKKLPSIKGLREAKPASVITSQK